MENKDIDSVLRKMGEERFIDLFKENEITRFETWNTDENVIRDNKYEKVR